VANALRLLKLPAEIQKSLEQGTISPGHARDLRSISDDKDREELYRDILAADLSVREAEKRASALSAVPATEKPGKDKAKQKTGAERAPEIGAMEEKFIGRLGTKVSIEGDLNKGRIYIEYYSMEDLERLYEIMGSPDYR
jgi:ParB family chromosome partitioning protein